MQKWEYCVITGVIHQQGRFEGHYPQLIFFGLNGISECIELNNKLTIPQAFLKGPEGGYIAHTIAKLGFEGWEMVGVGSNESGVNNLYFRRPIE